MDAESWCKVDEDKKQSWDRAQMRQFDNAYASSVFKPENQKPAVRLEQFVPVPVDHKQKRHFPKQHENQLKI